MRSVKLVAVVALLAGSVAFGASQIVYTLELGGNNHADLWEANQSPSFTKGAISGVPQVDQGNDITWAVRVSVGGSHAGNPGDGLVPYGAANLVFDLELYDNAGNLVSGFGAAPMAAQGSQNVPTDKGFWSSINDGDTAGTRGAIAPDVLANAAFAIGIRNTDPDENTNPDASGQMYALHDAAPNGPNFDYGWYPTANGRGGVDIAGTKAISTAVTGLDGKLVGFGAGYKSYDYTTYRPGVGIAYLTAGTDYGFGKKVDRFYASDPTLPTVAEVERVVFEGQICTKNLPLGTYTLKVKPSADGNNILHGAVSWNSPTADYGGFGSFAAKANEVYPNDTVGNAGMKFEVKYVPPPTAMAGRFVFYNQCAFDGNNINITNGGSAAAGDEDAIDTTKFPLVVEATPKASVFENYTTYTKGLNGLVYDVVAPTRTPALSDFTFNYFGRTGTMAAVPKTALAIAVWPGLGVGGSDRVLITFPSYVAATPDPNSIAKGWVEVTVGTGFGLPAAAGQNYAEKHWWGNAIGEAKDNAANMVINASDYSKIKASYKNPPTAPVSWDWDFDKNKACNALDISTSKGNYAPSPSTAVLKITK